MKSTPIATRKPKTALPRHDQKIARYARARLLDHPDLVLRALRHKATTRPATKQPEFVANRLLSSQ